MRLHLHARALIGAVLFMASPLVVACGLATPNDYRFELVQAQPAGEGKTTVTVRLIHVADNKPVAGAVLFESKTDMGPGGMAEMTGKVSPLPSDQPGIYRFQIETGMAGKWALNLGAKVQGEAGTVRAGMGTDAADYDGSGWQSLVIGNFTNEGMALYRNDGSGLFTDDAPATGLKRISTKSLTFGTFFFDYDLDGLPDILAVNGHVSDDISVVQPNVKYAQPPHLFRNLGKNNFDEVTTTLGPALQRAIVGRGAAYADFDNDGDLDLLITSNNGPARLLRNDNGNQNDMLRVKTVGTRSNRDGIGAKITVITKKGERRFGMVKTGSSYLSQSELPFTFGLGKPETGKAVSLEIVWPSGQKDSIPDVKPNQFITVKEGKGIISSRPIVFARPGRIQSSTPSSPQK